MLGGRGRGGDPTSDCILSSAWRRSPEAGEREEVVTRRRERTDTQRQEAGRQALAGSDPSPAFSLLPEPRHPGAQISFFNCHLGKYQLPHLPAVQLLPWSHVC